MFVIDPHLHLWDVTEENIVHEGGEQFIQCFYDYHTAFTPEEGLEYLEELILSAVTVWNDSAPWDAESFHGLTAGSINEKYDLQGVELYTAEWRRRVEGLAPRQRGVLPVPFRLRLRALEPDRLVDVVMDAELTEERRDESGVELDLETKRKIVGENAAELYDIDIEAKKREFQSDDVTEESGLGDHYGSSVRRRTTDDVRGLARRRRDRGGGPGATRPRHRPGTRHLHRRTGVYRRGAGRLRPPDGVVFARRRGG